MVDVDFGGRGGVKGGFCYCFGIVCGMFRIFFFWVVNFIWDGFGYLWFGVFVDDLSGLLIVFLLFVIFKEIGKFYGRGCVFWYGEVCCKFLVCLNGDDGK